MAAVAHAVAVVKRQRVYEIVRDQKRRRKLGEKDVPRHVPTHHCDRVRVPVEVKRAESKALSTTRAELEATLALHCCNKQCCRKLLPHSAIILGRRPLCHLISPAIERRNFLADELKAGYVVHARHIPPSTSIVLHCYSCDWVETGGVGCGDCRREGEGDCSGGKYFGMSHCICTSMGCLQSALH